MLEKNEPIAGILYKCINGEKLSGIEQQQLDEWIAMSPHNRQVYDEVMNPQLLEKEIKNLASHDKSEVWEKIKKGIGTNSGDTKLVHFFRTKYNRWAAAVILVLICATVYLIINRTTGAKDLMVNDQPVKLPANDIAPGTNRAVLQLADGTQIMLDSATNGVLASEGNSQIIKQDGLISYTKPGNAGDVNAMNMITTPRGGEYQVVLGDGTRAWLNAGSSINYPAVFGAAERKVAITGEVYFEVATEKARPFRVTVADATIEVLGTHFNVNAYKDEATIRTTLLQGSVKIYSGTKSTLLKPGEQARIGDGENITVGRADTEQVVAWKNNSFHFQDNDIESIMRQLARWYDAEIVYEGKVTNRYTGIISRDVNVSGIFKFLEMSGGVKTRIEGRKIIISP